MHITHYCTLVLFISFNLIYTVAGDAIATFSPCEDCPSSVKPQPITVTEQYQTVSTCKPTTECKPTTASICTLKNSNGKSCSTNVGTTCSAEYPYTTFAFVSTVIPCAGKESKVTVTKTDQPVTVGHVSSTSTSYTTYTAYPSASANGTYHNSTKPVTHVDIASIDVIVIDYVCPYNEIGEIGIWGYGGSGLCKECKPANDGSAHQVVDVHSCIGKKCTDYKETWHRGPTSNQVTPTQTYTATYAAQTDGVHTITLCPAAVTTTSISQPTTVSIPGTTAVCPSKGVYTVTVKPSTVTVVIADKPTTVSSGNKVTVCPSAGIYTWTIEPEICHTTTVTEDHTTLYYPATTTTCSSTGIHTLTVAPSVATTTSIFHCPITVTVTKVVTSTIVVGCPVTDHPTSSISSSAPYSYSATTTTSSSSDITSSTTSVSTPDPSSDPDPDMEVEQPKKRATVLEQPRFAGSKTVRRGGLLRSPRHAENEAKPVKARDFSIKKRALLH